MKFSAQITPTCPLFVKKDALQKVHTTNNLSFFLKKVCARGIHSSLECVIIMCMCVYICKQSVPSRVR